MHCQGKESLVSFALTLHKTVAVLYSKNFERDKDLISSITLYDHSAPSNLVHVSGIKASASGFEMVNNSSQVNMILYTKLHEVN